MDIKVPRLLEGLMYFAFFAAALPLALVGANDLLHHLRYPEMIEVRDSVLLVMSVSPAAKAMFAALAVAIPVALYFLVAGPPNMRIISAVLTGAWLLSLGLAPAFAPPPFASVARMYWDDVPFVGLALLPWICVGVRFRYTNGTNMKSQETEP